MVVGPKTVPSISRYSNSQLKKGPTNNSSHIHTHTYYITIYTHTDTYYTTIYIRTHTYYTTCIYRVSEKKGDQRMIQCLVYCSFNMGPRLSISDLFKNLDPYVCVKYKTISERYQEAEPQLKLSWLA